jgi:hypothetical protein
VIAYPFRNRVICRCYETGTFSLRELGEIWGVSGTRIRGIIYLSIRKGKRRPADV